MNFTRCVSCGQRFKRKPQVQRQRYCSTEKCQRERKRRWQKGKRRRDPDYQDNQMRAQKSWAKRNSGYWRKYRRKNKKYAESNRIKQRARNKKQSLLNVVGGIDCPVSSGLYRLVPIGTEEIAKMDVWTVEIRVLSVASIEKSENCKERT